MSARLLPCRFGSKARKSFGKLDGMPENGRECRPEPNGSHVLERRILSGRFHVFRLKIDKKAV